MKIYLAGTPGTQERERVAKNNKKQTAVFLGYITKSVFC